MELVFLLVKVFIIFNIIMGLASLCTWTERKGSALIQDRVGANRAGTFVEVEDIFGNFFLPSQYAFPLSIPVAMIRYAILAPAFMVLRFLGLLGVINTLLCDALKALTKEDFVPTGVSNFLHSLAPFMAVLPVFLAYSVIPFAPEFELFGTVVRMQVAQLDSGLLFLLAMGSIAVYGVILAGWTGNNKFSLLGALRASAQMISYELALGICFATVIVTYGTLDLYEIVEAQSDTWGVFSSAFGAINAVLLFVVGMAETKRGPFDLPESESELVAGYFTEYSGMKFLLFWLGEFAEIALFAVVLTVLCFGGWHLPFVDLPSGWLGALLGHAILMGKVVFFCLLQIVIRWTLPRFRYDQLMNLGWKILLPISLLNFLGAAVLKIS